MKILKIEKKWNERETQISGLSGGSTTQTGTTEQEVREKEKKTRVSFFFFFLFSDCSPPSRCLQKCHQETMFFCSKEYWLNRKLLSLNLNVINSYTKIYCPIQNLLINPKVTDT